MIQSTIAQCFTRKTPSKTTENADTDSRLQATKEAMHHASDFYGTNIHPTISAGNDAATYEPNQEDLHTYFYSIVSESNHLSLFKKMTEKSPSFIDMTLISSPATSTSINFTQNDCMDAATTQNDGNNSRDAKLSKLKMQWEETCLKWGFVVVRQLTYVQNTCSDILPTKTNEESPRALGSTKEEELGNNVSGLSIVVNGQIAIQEKDEIIVTHVIPNSPAHEAGMVEGDVIHAVYGMKEPTLSLLFGIMRDSSRFILTVKRMESSFDRSFRGKNGMISTTKRSMPSASTRHEGMGRCECNEESSCGEAGKAGNRPLNRNAEEPIRFDSVSETSTGDDSDYGELFGETVADDVTDKEAMLDITPNISEINSSFSARDRRACQDNQFHASTALGKIARGEMNPDKQYVLQKPISKNNQCTSKGKKEINSNIASAMESNTTTNNDSNLNQDETNVVNSFEPRGDSMEIRLSANKHFRRDDQSIPSNIEPKTRNRNDSISALSTVSKNSRATESYVTTKVEEDSINNINTENTGTLDTLDPDLLDSITHETNSISDEVLLSSLIEKSIENKVPNSSNVDQNSHKVTKKRKLSEIASISSKPIHADESRNQKNLLRNATSSPVEQRSGIDTNNRKATTKVDVVLLEGRLGKKKNSSKKYSDGSTRDGKDSTNQLVDRSNNDNTDFRKDQTFYPHVTTETRNKTVGGVELPSKKHSGQNSLKKAAGDNYAPNGSFDDKSIHENCESQSEQGAIDGSNHREMTQYSVESSKGRHNSISSLDFSTAEDDNDIKMTRASPLTIPRPSPLTVSRQPSKVTVTSTSSKAGLGPVKSAKLKRLWPDSSVFTKRILKWGPPELVSYDFNIRFKGNVRSNNKNKLPVVPSSFRDASEMIKYMSPHILDEGLYSIKQEFLANSDRNGLWTRDVFSMKLRHCIPVDPRPISNCNPTVRTFEFSCSLDSNNGLQPPCNLGEMFVIHSPSWKQKCCLGIIGSNDINSTFLADQMIEDDDSLDLFKLWICVCSEPMEDSGWLYEEDMPTKNPDGSFPAETMYMLNIGTCTDMMRQYEGLKSLACLKSNIKRAIYCSDIENIQRGEVLDELPSEPLTKPSCVCSTVWDHLRKTTNPFQLAAIEKIMSGKVKENIALLQGPPGTGKTSTTVALVSALLNGSVPLPGAKTGGTRVQVGRALQSSNDGVVKHNSSVGRRILVCAPSNQAVDELAWKIHTKALGGNGKIGCFNIVRFGMLPGEDRHDGRGKRSSRRESSFYGNERDNFLSAINLDKMVRDVAAGKEIYDFRSSDPISNTNTSENTRKSRYINFNVERQKILSRCHIVCTTLSGAGSKAFIESVSRDEYPHSEFDAVVIDEACQGSETSCLIPLKFNPNIIVLVGDPNQLPVMSLSPDASRCNSDRSLFERLHANGWPVNMLRIQYRMHPEIVKFPSKTFYNNNLITCDLIKNRKPSVWHNHLAFPPYLLWNIQNGVMARGPNGGISNNAEANFVVKLLASFSERYSDVRNIEIGIISFYNDQVGRIKEKVKDRNLMRWMNSNNISLQVSTVDGFQGSEKDIIILSCVRSRWVGNNISNNIGFLKDFRRVNVALTRAKHSLWVVAHCEMLNRDPLWNQLIDDTDKRHLIAETSDLERFLGTNRQTHHNRRRKGGTNKKSRHSKEKETKKHNGH